MPKSVTLENIIANEDPLANFNDGLAAGIDIMARRGWHKVTDDPDSLPDGKRPFVAFWEYSPGWTAAEVCTVRYEETPGGKVAIFETNIGLVERRSTPQYWCPLPDPNDFG